MNGAKCSRNSCSFRPPRVRPRTCQRRKWGIYSIRGALDLVRVHMRRQSSLKRFSPRFDERIPTTYEDVKSSKTRYSKSITFLFFTEQKYKVRGICENILRAEYKEKNL